MTRAADNKDMSEVLQKLCIAEEKLRDIQLEIDCSISCPHPWEVLRSIKDILERKDKEGHND